jgi:dihydrofolate reductase
MYSAITSLDGYVADAEGNFDWAAPSDELHAFVNDLERPIGTALYGRRMYEVMVAWENPETFAGESSIMWDFAEIWQATDKVVYSKMLENGTRCLPDAVRLTLELLDERRFGNGVVHLHYRTGPATASG